MIKLFRNIRQNLLAEGKTSRYLKYAIGEIILVVIGILIALSINNWNENRKQNRSMHIAIKSMIEDLQQDTLQLHADMKSINVDLSSLNNFRERLSKPTATIDTLKHIARFEYLPFFNPSNEMHRNTIVSLLSTGNLDYFNEKLKTKILNHNAEQLNLIKVMDENVSIFLNSQYGKGIVYQSENKNGWMVGSVIKGPLLDIYWNNKVDTQLLDDMLSTISGKILMYSILITTKQRLLDKTTEMLEYLNKFENDQ